MVQQKSPSERAWGNLTGLAKIFPDVVDAKSGIVLLPKPATVAGWWSAVFSLTNRRPTR